MVRRVVIPVSEENGLESRLSEHFGRAPYFISVDIAEDGEVSNLKIVSNTSEHFGGMGKPTQRILQLKPNVVITYGMGPRALSIFQNARVAVLRTDTDIVREVISSYNRGSLEELTEGCHEARHQ